MALPSIGLRVSLIITTGRSEARTQVWLVLLAGRGVTAVGESKVSDWKRIPMQ